MAVLLREEADSPAELATLEELRGKAVHQRVPLKLSSVKTMIAKAEGELPVPGPVPVPAPAPEPDQYQSLYQYQYCTSTGTGTWYSCRPRQRRKRSYKPDSPEVHFASVW